MGPNRFEKIIKYLANPCKILHYFGCKGRLNFLPDKIYLKIVYRACLNKKLDLSNPQTFNGKMQWLKLYDRNPIYTQMVDKYEVRKYIEQAIGKKFLIPLFGVFENANEIDFNKLPKKFVLKCTHDSGSVIICEDKFKLNYEEVKSKLNKCLKRNFYYSKREWPYKNIKPRIICEKLLESHIFDYKIFCFNGIAKFLYVGQGLVSDHSLKIDFFDISWRKMNFKRTDYSNFKDNLSKPKHLEEMVKLAEELSSNIAFVRVDLYEVAEKLYFSEFTFTPGGGLIPFEPANYDEIIGSWIKLPEKRKLAYD